MSGGSPARVDQRSVRSRAEPSRTGASELQRPAPHPADPPRRLGEQPTSTRQLYDGLDRPDSDSLRRRRYRGRSSDSVSTPSAPPVAEPSATPWRLQSLLIRGGRASDVHVSLVTGGGHGPTPVAAEAGGTAPKRTGERRRVIAEQPLRRRARGTQSPSRA
jgi:hypothetical protein